LNTSHIPSHIAHRRSHIVPAIPIWFCLGTSVLFAGAGSSEVQKWLENVDAARNAFPEAVIRARATQIVAGKPDGSADFEIYVKGQDKSLIVFRGGSNSGRRVLTVGDRMWLMVPGASRPVPITANQRLMGGASIGDVARLRFATDYAATARPGTEAVNGRTCRVLDLSAKSPRAPFPRVTIWYDEASRVPARIVFALVSGKAARQVDFTKFARQDGRTTVAEMEVRDLLASESRAVTRLEYLSYRPAKLDDSIFTTEGAGGV
jgi:hypothetical protein